MSTHQQDADFLTSLGYRVTSRRHRLVTRVDRPDWREHMAKEHSPWSLSEGLSWVACLGDGAADQYRRVYSKDYVEVTSSVIKLMKSSGFDPTGYIDKSNVPPMPKRDAQIHVVNRSTYRRGYHIGEHVKITRPFLLGNPFGVKGGIRTREQAISQFRVYLWNQLRTNTPVAREIKRLVDIYVAGNDIILICCCKPLKCHGDIIRNAIIWLAQNKSAVVNQCQSPTCVTGADHASTKSEQPEVSQLGHVDHGDEGVRPEVVPALGHLRTRQDDEAHPPAGEVPSGQAEAGDASQGTASVHQVQGAVPRNPA